MAIDNSKLAYSSTWNIDQLVATGEVAIPAGPAYPIYTIPSSLPGIPVFEVQFKPSGSNKWFQVGAYTLNNTYISYDLFDAYISGGVLYMFSQPGTARYFVWSDKADY